MTMNIQTEGRMLMDHDYSDRNKNAHGNWPEYLWDYHMRMHVVYCNCTLVGLQFHFIIVKLVQAEEGCWLQ